jgi:hypothetical protein
MNKIICILEKGFSKIALPNGDVINITSCDDGCYITTDNMEKDIEAINKYVGLPVYEIALDNNCISKGYKLGECKITNHCKYDYGYKCIFWNTESITGDNTVIEVG